MSAGSGVDGEADERRWRFALKYVIFRCIGYDRNIKFFPIIFPDEVLPKFVVRQMRPLLLTEYFFQDVTVASGGIITFNGDGIKCSGKIESLRVSATENDASVIEEHLGASNDTHD